LSDGKGNTPLHYAAKYSRLSIVEQICSEVSSIQAQNSDGWSAAHFAAACGSLPVLRCLSSFGDSLSTENRVNWTPLHYALKYRHKSVVEFLVKCRVPIDFKCVNMGTILNDQHILSLLTQGELAVEGVNHNGWSPLHFASANGAERIIDTLVGQNKGNEAASRDRLLRTALMQAAVNGQLGVLRRFERIGVDGLSSIDRFGLNPLHLAAEAGQASLVRYLVEKIPVNSKDFRGQTALHLAAHRGHLHFVTELLDINPEVDINARDIQGKTPLYVACQNSHGQVVDFLLTRGASRELFPEDGISLISLAVQKRDSRMLDRVATPGIDIFAPDRKKWTPVHYAAQGGARDYLALFAGIDPSSFFRGDLRGRIPLHIAVEWNQPESLTFCAEVTGADPNARDAEGNTALHIAVRRGHRQMIEMLLRSSICDINAQNNGRESALHIAITTWASDLIEQLVSRDDCEINIADLYGMTPIILAAKLGQRQTVAFLARRGDLKADAADIEGRTAAHYAAMHKTPFVVQTMLGIGTFDFSVRDRAGSRPIDIARERKHEKVVATLLEALTEEEDTFLILVADTLEEEEEELEEEEEEEKQDSE
jgi:ankyrin repeat protein